MRVAVFFTTLQKKIKDMTILLQNKFDWIKYQNRKHNVKSKQLLVLPRYHIKAISLINFDFHFGWEETEVVLVKLLKQNYSISLKKMNKVCFHSWFIRAFDFCSLIIVNVISIMINNLSWL